MASRRVARVSEAIRETVAETILLGLRDPRIRNVTVLRAEVTGDLQHAKIYVSIMGPSKVKALAMQGLQAARGYIQAKVSNRLQTKVTPILRFELDEVGAANAAEAARILQELEAERLAASAEGESTEAGEGTEPPADQLSDHEPFDDDSDDLPEDEEE